MNYKQKEAKISFLSKEDYTCPVCSMNFKREELLSGSGRLIAGSLTDELHRLYEPSSRYGEIHPLVYQATVCPRCWFAAMDKDFVDFPKSRAELVSEDMEKRVSDIKLLFPDTDFDQNRNLNSGIASLYLVVRCYEYFPKEFSPTIKQAIASLRAGWLIDEMDRKYPNQNYDWLALLFKKKATFFYNESIRKEQRGIETLSALKNFGPDTDKNYSYEGALYLTALLRYKYSYLDNAALRIPALEEARRTIAKMFGVGKSSKAKPGPLLEHARNLYESISKELNESDEK